MMELSGTSYTDILKMPVNDLTKYIDWKIEFDKQREKAKADAMNRR